LEAAAKSELREYNLQVSGYPGLRGFQAGGFDIFTIDGVSQMAVSSLLKDPQNLPEDGRYVDPEKETFITEISNEGSIFFRTTALCKKNPPDQPDPVKVIEVAEQKVYALYVCQELQTQSGTSEVYFPLSDEAQSYVVNAFLENSIVYVRFDSMALRVPFRNTNFRHSLESIVNSKPPL
tara:strand:+ start:270 stop:806 length:537 start_codon:yes stop_codon:yes gene_type:complete